MSSPMEPSQQNESPLTKALAVISANKWNMYKNDFVPVENQYMDNIDQMNTPGLQEVAGNMANAEANRQYQPVLDKASSQLIQSGIAPDSGAYAAKIAGLRSAGASGIGQATFLAKQGQQDRYRAGLESIVGIGNGQSAVAGNSVSDLARQSVDAAKQQTAMDWGSKAAEVKGIGNVSGMLANAGLSAVMK